MFGSNEVICDKCLCHELYFGELTWFPNIGLWWGARLTCIRESLSFSFSCVSGHRAHFLVCSLRAYCDELWSQLYSWLVLKLWNHQ